MKIVPLNKGLFSIVDDCDYDLVSQHKWHANYNPKAQSFYAMTAVRCENGKQRRIALHRLILGVTDPGIFVDHKNHDTLLNTRENLRQASQRQNQQNQLPRIGASKFKGVSKTSGLQVKPWRAQIRTVDGRLHLGSFYTEDEAALVYDRAALEHHGEFAHLNFPEVVNKGCPAP